MPISALSAGNDTAYAPPARAGALTLDYLSSDRGPTRAAPRQVAAAPAEGPERIYEGTDALAALSRDLAGGGAGSGLLSLQEVVVPQPAAEPIDIAALDPGAEFSDEPATRSSWRDDDIKGRRLGDRSVPESDESGTESWLFGEGGFGFDDLIDIVNPLQHIPIVSSIYRWITGDEIAPAASVAGGALFGGPIGMAGAIAGVAVEEATGRDLGAHAIAMMLGDDSAAGQVGDPALDPADTANLAAAPTAPAPQMALAGAPAAQRVSEDAPARVFGRIPQSSLPAIGASTIFVPADRLAPDRGAESAVRDANQQPDIADGAIAAQMMDALSKYEALVRARVGAAPSIEPAAGSLYDGTI